jgi:formimidoylglutamate deiminase
LSALRCWAEQAWIDGAWREQVLLEAGADGCWRHVAPGVAEAPPGVERLAGPALPGLVDAHSHAFQRAFAGLAERRDAEHDDFWSWRDRMYGVALRVTPEQLQAIAAQLYVELLAGGYTQVCEFHYLQHREDGAPYDDPATLAWSLADAAADSGIGLTVLPVLYERAGFDAPALRADQRRFATAPVSVRALQRAVAAAHRPHVNAGVAIHSLRAASPASIEALLRDVGDDDLPIHVHVAEQTLEVSDCVAATGARPIEWLGREVPLDARWQLVHATHATAAEIDLVAARGAGIVVCPSTEANLGDGLPDLAAWLGAGVPLAIGSDSQVSRSAVRELRLLEDGQRLALRRRNVAAAAAQPSTAARLFSAALGGGAAASGRPRWGLRVGARADLLVLDLRTAGLHGVPPSHRLDALVFATDAPAFRDVFVAGERVVADHRHRDAEHIGERFAAAMAALWP